jgi:hypothetical protein
MHKDRIKSYLELQIVWKDDHMFELKVTASNGRYFGTTNVYDTTESLSNFAQTLIGFPKNDKKLLHEAGDKDAYAYFSMNFYCINNAGHIGVEINLESNVATELRQGEKDKIKLEIIVEPSAIDNFQKQLIQLAAKQEGTSILYGRDNRLDN